MRDGEMKQTWKKILGFRSGKPWKMLLAVAWYILSLIILFFGLTTSIPVLASTYDQMIYRISAVILVLWLLSPTIFLSETAARNYLPLFRKRQAGFTIVGMMIVFIFFTYLFASVESLHSAVYQNAFDSYIQTAYQGFVDAGSRSAD